MNMRPKSLKEIAERSDSIGDFGRHLRDWLHEVRKLTTPAHAWAAIAEEPRLLRDCFTNGNIADAWLGAYAEHLSGKIGYPAPEWAFASVRVAADPIFDEGGDSPNLRLLALRDSPPAFKRRNIYTPSVDLRLQMPAVSLE